MYRASGENAPLGAAVGSWPLFNFCFCAGLVGGHELSLVFLRDKFWLSPFGQLGFSPISKCKVSQTCRRELEERVELRQASSCWV